MGQGDSVLLIVIYLLSWYEIGSYISVRQFYSLGPTDAIWRHRNGSTLVEVIAYCLTAPSQYLNQLLRSIPVKFHRKCTRYAGNRYNFELKFRCINRLIRYLIYELHLGCCRKPSYHMHLSTFGNGNVCNYYVAFNRCRYFFSMPRQVKARNGYLSDGYVF